MDLVFKLLEEKQVAINLQFIIIHRKSDVEYFFIQLIELMIFQKCTFSLNLGFMQDRELKTKLRIYSEENPKFME